MTRLTRRQALRLAALTYVSSTVAACGLTRPAASPTPAAPVATPPPRQTPTADATPTPTPTPAPRRTFGVGLAVGVTPNDEFYHVGISQRSDWLRAETFALSVTGAVNQPLLLSLDDVKALPAVEQMRTLECIGNPSGGDLIGNATWKGTRLAGLLQTAGLRSTAIEIKLTGADGYATSVPVSIASHPDALLVYEMNGAPLPAEHGAPLRVLLPGLYGQKQPKWITSVEAITEPFLGFWERNGWSNDATVKVNAQIRTPEDGEVIGAASYPISGTVFANSGGVAKVEVSADGGKTWQDARLVHGPTPLAWSEWRHEWLTPASGAATIIARATDNDGNRQPFGADDGKTPDSLLEGSWKAHDVQATVEK